MNQLQIICAIQAKLNVPVDGQAGPVTWAAIYRELFDQDPRDVPASEQESPRIDDRSEAAISTLLPEVRPLARLLVIAAGKAGIVIKVIGGSRTYEEQDELYAQGRTKPGDIVTRARGGYSWHNFGMAFDIGVFESGRYVPESPLYREVGKIGKTLGLEWGGDWQGSLVDEPHFQFNPLHLTLAQLRQRHATGERLV